MDRCIGTLVSASSIYMAVAISSLTPVDAQEIIEQDIQMKVVSLDEETGKSISRSEHLFEPGTFKKGDTFSAVFGFNARNTSDEQRELRIGMFWVNSGKTKGVQTTYGAVLREKPTGMLSFQYQLPLNQVEGHKSIECRWYIQWCATGDLPYKERVYVDVPGGQGRFIWNLEPLSLEQQVALIPEPVRHECNWLELGREEIVGNVYRMLRDGKIRISAAASDAIEEAGMAYGQQFRELSEQLKDEEISYEDESIALAVAMKKQFEAIQNSLELEQLTNVIKHANKCRLQATYIDDHPADVAFLKHPKMADLIELDGEQKAKLDQVIARDRKFHIEANEELAIKLKKTDDKDRHNSIAAAHLKKIDENNKQSFDEMMALLTEKQRAIYATQVGLNAPYQSVYKSKE